MEENDVMELFEIFRTDLKDDLFSKFFYVSLCGNLWYHKENDKIYFVSKDKHHELSLLLVNYRNREFFKRDNTIEYFEFGFGDNTHENYGRSWGLISDTVKKSDQFTKFEVLKNTIENIEYIKVLSRDSKINKLIKNEYQ